MNLRFLYRLMLCAFGLLAGTAGMLKVNARKKSLYYHCTAAQQYTLNKRMNNDSDTMVSRLLSLYRDSLSLKMEDIIVNNKFPLTKTQPESTLGNWIADAAKSIVAGKNKPADACILNYGSIGKEYIAPGPIRRKDFYELIPFENRLVLLSVSGILLRTICDSIAAINGLPVSGISFTIDHTKAAFILINKQPVKDHLMYTLLLNDYLLSSRTFAPLIGKLYYQPAGVSLRQALLEYASILNSKNIAIEAHLENRTSYAD